MGSGVCSRLLAWRSHTLLTAAFDEGRLPQRARIHIRLTSAIHSDLARRATASGLSVSTIARQLIEAALEQELDSDVASSSRGMLNLAALIAAEHAVLMVASILPEGEQRKHSLAARAAEAAEERLALISESGR